MNRITYVTPGFAVTSAPAPADFAEAAAMGFRAVINNRPDSEEAGQPRGTELGELARGADLGYRHIPARMADLFDDTLVTAMRQALDTLDGPVLAHCKSGMRSAILWAAAEARVQPVDTVIEIARQAGFDFEVLRDRLEEVAQQPQGSAASQPTAGPSGGEAA